MHVILLHFFVACFFLNVRNFKFLFIQLDFESYFIKLICIQCHISFHLGGCIVLRLVA